MKLPYTKSSNPVTILIAVAKAILQEPKRYDQGTFGDNATEGLIHRFGDLSEERIKSHVYPSCGTVACVAGWACVVTGTLAATDLGAHYDSIAITAQNLLGLTDVQHHELFDGIALRAFGHINRRTSGTKAYARAGVKHIRAFIEKHYGKAEARRFSQVLITSGDSKRKGKK